MVRDHYLDGWRVAASRRSAAEFWGWPNTWNHPQVLTDLRLPPVAIRSITISNPESTKDMDLVFTFKTDQNKEVMKLFAATRGVPRLANPRTLYLRLPAHYFELRTLITVLRKVLVE